jgi:hypothetical protein
MIASGPTLLTVANCGILHAHCLGNSLMTFTVLLTSGVLLLAHWRQRNITRRGSSNRCKR